MVLISMNLEISLKLTFDRVESLACLPISIGK